MFLDGLSSLVLLDANSSVITLKVYICWETLGQNYSEELLRIIISPCIRKSIGE